MKLIKRLSMAELTAQGLRVFGLIAAVAGMVSALLQNAVLDLNSTSTDQLLLALENDPSSMNYVTMAIIFQALEACSVPIFSFLLVEGATHTESFRKYALRVVGVALLSEIPFDLVMSGSPVSFTSQNPVFGLVLAMVMLFFFRHFPEKKAGHIIIKLVAIAGCFLWSNMLGITHGACIVVLTAVLWALRGRQNLQTLLGIVVMLCCCLFSPFYIVGILAFMVINFYGGQKGVGNRVVNYLAYPVILLIFALLSIIIG